MSACRQYRNRWIGFSLFSCWVTCPSLVWSNIGKLLPKSELQTESEYQLNSNVAVKSDQQSFDDSVFLTISNRGDVEENVTGEQESAEPTITTLNTVKSTIQDENEPLNTNESQCFPAQLPTFSNDQPNELITPSINVSTASSNLSTVIEDVKSKQRKISNPLAQPEVSFTDAKETELYSKLTVTNEIPITCKRNHAFLYKNKLGSGRKGKCIKFADEWYTPSEFEIFSGLEMSKDWKRSLRYGGRSLLNLVNRGYLRPHAATCTCGICSEDPSLTGPVLYYTPKIRRKRSATASLSTGSLSVEHDSFRPSTAPPIKQFSQPFAISNPRLTFENEKDLPSQLPADIVDVLKSTNLPLTKETRRLFQALAENEQKDRKIWSKLEKKAESMMEKFEQLQQSIFNAKKESEDRRDKILKEMYIVLTDQNHYVPNHSTSHLVKTLDEKKFCEDIHEEEDDEVPEICGACGNPANSECTGCRKATYCSTECQEMDWNRGHRDVCRSLANQDSNSSTNTEIQM
ncbi:deformed epidermal autoregulatory factor 1 homolog isoform X4 [Styela clava]